MSSKKGRTETEPARMTKEDLAKPVGVSTAQIIAALKGYEPCLDTRDCLRVLKLVEDLAAPYHARILATE